MSAAPHLIRAASLTGYVELARAAGLDPYAMMRKVALPRRILDDPEALISLGSVRRLLELSADAADMEDFGLRLASRRRLSNLGPVSLILRQEPTGLRAVQTLINYNRLLNDALLAQVDHDEGLAIIREQILAGSAVPTRQMIELTVGVMFQFLREVLGPSWHPRVVCFMHRAPQDRHFHHAFLGKSLEFNAGFNGIVCRMADLERELPATEPGLAGFAKRFLDTALSKKAAVTSETVRHLIAALLGNGRCTVDKVAQHLGVSRQTLHRRLLQEEETFSSLLNAVRKEFALRLVKESDRPLDDIAAMLGFSSASAFAHWFRAEFARSFVQWRRECRSVSGRGGGPAT